MCRRGMGNGCGGMGRRGDVDTRGTRETADMPLRGVAAQRKPFHGSNRTCGWGGDGEEGKHV